MSHSHHRPPPASGHAIARASMMRELGLPLASRQDGSDAVPGARYPDGVPFVSLADMRASMERELRKAGVEHRA